MRSQQEINIFLINDALLHPSAVNLNAMLCDTQRRAAAHLLLTATEEWETVWQKVHGPKTTYLSLNKMNI